MTDKVADSKMEYKLHKDGFVIIKNVLNKEEIHNIKQQCNENNYQNTKKYLINHDKLKQIILKEIGNINYIFQDYIWIIQKSSVHTCHRDNNGDFFNNGQKYPSYTLLIYLENLPFCLQ